MSRLDAQHRYMPSVLDRLIDPESGGVDKRRGYGPEQMVAAVRRDLEDLLNTRQTQVGLPEELVELHRSIYAYGLPDLNSLNAISPQQRAEIGRMIEAVVVVFEPRLKDIRAFLMESTGGGQIERSVRFRIEARLNVDPAPEVAFDTILELTTGRYTVNSTIS
jgi:type VI secretion system protein ImpF